MGCAQSGAKAATSDGKSGGVTAVDKQQAKEENKKYEETMSFLSQVPLFMRLPKDQHPILAAACVNQPFKAGQTIITQGETGREFFIIQSGEAEVSVNDGGSQKKVATLKQGDYFGENALLRNEPRSATIKAVSEIKTLKITQEKFQQLGLNEKIQFANRKAVGAGGKRQLVVKPPSDKTATERQLMETALKKNENIQTMVELDEVRVKQIIDIAWKETVPSGKEIIAQGDLAADYFYICQSGKFEIFVSDKNDSDRKLVQTVVSGGSFGELALLYLVPRAATVVAKEDSVVWVIDRKNFKDILMKVSDEKIQEYVKYLNRVEILSSLLAAEKQQVAKALTEKKFSKNEVIIQQGDPGTTFYILFEGEVSVSIDGDEKARLQASEERGTAQYFGERALLNDEPRAATVRVVSKDAKALALDKEAFDLLLGPLEDIMARKGEATAKAVAPPAGEAPAPSGRDPNRPKILMTDLQKVGLLGAGGFGAVELWEHKHSGETYAMKCISKGFIVKTGMQDSVITEKNILFMTNSDFIIRLHETYNSKQSIYFLMEPALGGELYSMYQRKGFYGSEKHAKFYSAGVLCAFDHLHERHIIYRDLKPENLLLNEKGHLKVTDMGLAKFVIGKTYTTCGTPDYFAPEVIASTGHNHAVDWWMLGVLIFEFMTGSAPFEAPYPMQIYAKVLKGINAVKFPPQLSPQCVEIVKAICQKEPADRLPMLTGGSKNIKTHSWYKGFNWDKFTEFTLEAPFIPKVKSKKDLANFSVHPDEMPRFIEYVDDGTGWDKDFATC
ncbi:cGMP-dependent protein kinase [Durusdinium trenchii]|uniref:cGMP-dependent protein kinase n=1 Tax=Durusdinium trenchii TaxID=1381693 RepID=A0ABP0J7D3_9DINO